MTEDQFQEIKAAVEDQPEPLIVGRAALAALIEEYERLRKFVGQWDGVTAAALHDRDHYKGVAERTKEYVDKYYRDCLAVFGVLEKVSREIKDMMNAFALSQQSVTPQWLKGLNADIRLILKRYPEYRRRQPEGKEVESDD